MYLYELSALKIFVEARADPKGLSTYIAHAGLHGDLPSEEPLIINEDNLPLLNLIKTNYQFKYQLLKLKVFLHKLNINLFNMYFCSVAVTYWGLPKLHSISNQDDKKMSDRTRDIYCF